VNKSAKVVLAGATKGREHEARSAIQKIFPKMFFVQLETDAF
jgi:hypothetical protein